MKIRPDLLKPSVVRQAAFGGRGKEGSQNQQERWNPPMSKIRFPRPYGQVATRKGQLVSLRDEIGDGNQLSQGGRGQSQDPVKPNHGSGPELQYDAIGTDRL